MHVRSLHVQSARTITLPVRLLDVLGNAYMYVRVMLLIGKHLSSSQSNAKPYAGYARYLLTPSVCFCLQTSPAIAQVAHTSTMSFSFGFGDNEADDSQESSTGPNAPKVKTAQAHQTPVKEHTLEELVGMAAHTFYLRR